MLNDNRFAARLPVEIQRVVVDCYFYAFHFIPGMCLCYPVKVGRLFLTDTDLIVLSTCSCLVALVIIVSQKEKKLR